MNINETYLKFLNKVNKNFINDNISVDKGRFVITFNEAQNKYTSLTIKENNTSSIRNIQFLKVKNGELSKSSSNEDFDSFSLPSNFFRFVNVRAKAKKGSCTDYFDILFEAKGDFLVLNWKKF